MNFDINKSGPETIPTHVDGNLLCSWYAHHEHNRLPSTLLEDRETAAVVTTQILSLTAGLRLGNQQDAHILWTNVLPFATAIDLGQNGWSSLELVSDVIKGFLRRYLCFTVSVARYILTNYYSLY